MNPDRWQELQDLFHRALEMPSGDRPRWLADVCPSPEVRAEVEELIAAYEQSADTLAPSSPSIDDLSRDLEGQSIGPYTIFEEIGRGGMSVVYRAGRNDEGFERPLAFKVLRTSPLQRTLEAKLQSERRILARLEHPNIARLLDGGVTETGLPYVVMEFVAGSLIDRHCDERRFTIEDRVRLLARIAETVQFAHGRLVVHSDLKPANILVTVDGEPKLLDFGISRLLDADSKLDSPSGETGKPASEVSDQDEPNSARAAGVGVRALTPSYASPEQLRGEPVTTASDVYSLGILLNELITGRLPFDRYPPDADSPISSRAPVQAPSFWFRPEAGWEPEACAEWSPKNAAASRGAEPAQIRDRLEGDLDAITCRCLSENPGDRYGSAGDLARDLNNWLEQRPIIARDGGRVYRAGKFLRRHRASVTASGLGVVLLAVAISALIALVLQMGHERDRLAEERDRARQVAAFLVDSFEATEGSDDMVTAQDLIDSGAERLAQNLELDPQLRTELLVTLASIYDQLGHFDRAEPLALEAVRLRKQHLQANDPRIGQALHLHASILAHRGDYKAASELEGRAVMIFRRASDVEGLARSLSHLGWLDTLFGRMAEAEIYIRRSLDIRRELFGEDHVSVADSLALLADLLQQQGKLSEAEDSLRRADQILLTAVGSERSERAMVLKHLGGLLRLQERFSEARNAFEEALAIEREALGESHVRTAGTKGALGTMLLDLGDYDEAERYLDECLVVRRAKFGPSHPRVVETMTSLAAVHRQRGDLDRAESILTEALRIARTSFPENSPMLAYPLTYLARLQVERGRSNQAISLFSEAYERRKQAMPPDDILVVKSRTALIDSLRAVGRIAEADRIAADSNPEAIERDALRGAKGNQVATIGGSP